LHDHSYATATKHGWHEPRIETVAVDLVGHAWFLRTEWIHYLFAERATLGTNGEDIELAARAMRMAGIPCYCPPHPPRDMSFWGSTRGDEFGNDEHASFRRSDHVPERDHIVRSEIAKGWRPLFMQGNSTGGVGPEPAMPERQAAGTQKCNLEKPEAPEIDRKPVPTDAGRKTQNDNAEDLSDASVGALVALVPQSAQRVLHIGDARSKVLERPEDSRQLTVVEVEPPQLLLAIARATKETIEPETTDGMWQGPFGTFDAIVCEVFDYFRDSMQVLAFVRERLNPHGTLVLRVPNARHHSIIEGLIEGEPPGPVAGTDQTANGRPKRVFTRREIEKLLFRGWFHVSGLRVVPGPGHAQWLRDGRAGLVRVGSLHITGMEADEAEEFYAAGYLVAATPAPVPVYGLTSIVIVTHNQLEYTRRCVDSILERTDEPYELIFVDNGSADGTLEWLRTGQPLAVTDQSDVARCGSGETEDRSRENDGTASSDTQQSLTLLKGLQRVTVITNQENRGFPIAANQGIRVSKGNQVLLLNNDTIVTTGWLRRMLEALAGDSRIGLVGPCSNHVSGSQCVAVSYQQLEDLDGFAWDWGKRNNGIYADTDRLVGFCLLIRREVISAIGLLDEQFSPGNFEDDDYCLRTIEAGFRAVIARSSFVHHFGERTFAASNIRFTELLNKNRQLFQQKLRAKALSAR
jgi:GT2 family glycosyltransferase